jgi:adenylosuccinate lyase
VREGAIARRVAEELPFMATEKILMEAVLRGGDRQHLHERIRRHSLDAQAALERGEGNPLIASIAEDEDFPLSRQEIEAWLDPAGFTGRSAAQVDEFLTEVVEPALEGVAVLEAEAPRV